MAAPRPAPPAVLTLLAAAGLLAACQSDAPQGGNGGPTPVGVVTLAPQPVDLTSEMSGRVTAYEVSEVRPQIGGIVTARLFTEGALVRQGQPLYQIDPAPYQAQLDSARAGLAQARATLGAAKLKAERYRELVTTNAVSRQDNDDAQAAYQQALANVAAQQAAVRQAEINLGYTRVMAPISGRIGKSTVTAGALVTAGQADALATIHRLDPVYVDITQSAADLLRLRKAMNGSTAWRDRTADVALTLEDGSAYPGKGTLKFSEVAVDPAMGSVTLRAQFANPDGLLLPGMYVRATLPRQHLDDALLVPQAAVSRDAQGHATTLVVGPNNKAELRPIQVGQAVGSRWLVSGGLKAGDAVIVDGLQQLRPGMPVKPTLVTSKG
ncbi:efflux RND transporter periplasmic adaptor subunit [Parapedomonas caeni]